MDNNVVPTIPTGAAALFPIFGAARIDNNIIAASKHKGPRKPQSRSPQAG
jgi:hypothetical protein